MEKLIELRRQREDQALSELAAHQQDMIRLQHDVEKAGAALTEHRRVATDRERARLASLIGQRLSVSVLANLQSALNASDDQRGTLEETEQDAKENLETKQQETQKARIAFWLRHKQTEKLKTLASMQHARQQANQLAITETEDEDRYNGQSSSRNADA